MFLIQSNSFLFNSFNRFASNLINASEQSFVRIDNNFTLCISVRTKICNSFESCIRYSKFLYENSSSSRFRNRTIVGDAMRFTWYPRWTMGTSSLVDCGTWTQSRSAFSNVIQCPETWLERKPNTETSTNNGPGTFVRHRIIFDRLATASVNRGGGRVNDRATSAFRARFPRANNNCANLQVNPDLFFLF